MTDEIIKKAIFTEPKTSVLKTRYNKQGLIIDQIKDLVKNGGAFNKELLAKNFEIKKLIWTQKKDLSDEEKKTIKSRFLILQVGFFFKCVDKIAVFLRPSHPLKITKGFSLLDSFSPDEYSNEAFDRHLFESYEVKCKDLGLKYNFFATAYNDLLNLHPSYLFLIHEINIEENGITSKSKDIEISDKIVNWYPISDLYNGKAFYNDPKTGQTTKITFEGNVDMMLLEALFKSENKVFTSRNGEGYLNRNTKLIFDSKQEQLIFRKHDVKIEKGKNAPPKIKEKENWFSMDNPWVWLPFSIVVIIITAIITAIIAQFFS